MASMTYNPHRKATPFWWDLLVGVIGAIMVLFLAFAVVFTLCVGIDKSMQIKERTYYDKELGRTVYAEKGV